MESLSSAVLPDCPVELQAPLRLQREQLEFELSEQQEQQLLRLLAVSPLLGRCLKLQPHLLDGFLSGTASFSVPDLSQPHTEAQAMAALRRFRNASLCQCLADDLLRQQPIERALQRVSQLADLLINLAYQWAWHELIPQWGQPLDSAGRAMPLLMLGMGKLGGGELNFSSDIDLIFVYPENGETSGGRRSAENQQFYTKLGQKIILLLNQVTADGFVYRVDMRLRPFGDSGPLVLSFAAFEDYYQAQGRDWERYAMLKARILNPEPPFAAELQAMLKPFVYRRYIDFSAIESLRRMKQLIEQENRRRNRVDNIKLGAGGIREVEFIIQTLQLIRGGRIPSIQQQSIFAAMQALRQEGLLDPEAQQMLRADYLLLRRVEHWLQGMDDQQTQTLPADALSRQRLVLALGAVGWPELQQQINAAMVRIHQQFRQVIAQEDNAEPQELLLGRLLWDSEQTAAELAEHLDWLEQPAAELLIQHVQQFKADSQKRQVGPRGRELLAKLLPLLLHVVAQEQAGPEDGVDQGVGPVAAGEADHLVGDPRDHGHEQDPGQDQEPQVGAPDEGEDDDRDHHHPQQERGAAAQVDARVAGRRLRRARVARLERVDRHVLGGVVHEDPAQVRQERQHEQVADEERHADQALDQHEQERALDGHEARGDAGHDLEEDDREDQRRAERDRDLLAAELGLAPALAGLAVLAVVVGGRQPRGDGQRPHADHERLAERDHAADHGPAQDGAAQRDGAGVLDDGGDAPVGPAHADGPRRRRAHHHALDDGLAPDGGFHGVPPGRASRPGRTSWRAAC